MLQLLDQKIAAAKFRFEPNNLDLSRRQQRPQISGLFREILGSFQHGHSIADDANQGNPEGAQSVLFCWPSRLIQPSVDAMFAAALASQSLRATSPVAPC